MTTSASGRIIDENGVGLARLGVLLQDISRQYDVRLDSTTTREDGTFELHYADDLTVSPSTGKPIRTLRLRIRLGQHVLKEIVRPDLSARPALVFEPITLARAEAESWWATLGSGAPSRMTPGNAVRWLIDNVDAWGRSAEVIKRATALGDSKSKLDLMQLEIDIDKFNAETVKENPVVVLRFDPTVPIDAAHPRAMTLDDERIERLIADATQRFVDVRIQIPRMTIDTHGIATIGGAVLGIATLVVLGGVVAILVSIVAGLAIIAGIIGLLWVRSAMRDAFSKPKLEKWLKDAQDARAISVVAPVRLRELRMRSTMVTHSKILIERAHDPDGVERGREALLLGSPFEQVYFDSLGHGLDDPRRGRDATKGPIHEASVGVRGPAVAHLQEVFNSHWNLADPADKLPMPPPQALPVNQAEAGEFLTRAQVVRTFDSMFTPGADGEAGVLEAYLRAIHFAERFIYIENQYFNNALITQALIDALVAKPGLVAILLLNVSPDMPLYLGWQQDEIRRIVGSFRDGEAARRQFGVFTTWSHARSDTAHPKPRLVDNYLHTKTALIDNRWATVGSANLDGASLDFIQYARAALDGAVRNTEANLVVFEETPLQPSAVDALRRQLWGEHLGLDPASSELDDAPGKNWLPLWRQKAGQKLAGLESNLDAVSPIRILPRPAAAYEASLGFRARFAPHGAARKYLQHLFSPDEKPSEVLESQFEVLAKGPVSFTFKY